MSATGLYADAGDENARKANARKADPLFQTHEPIAVTITADFKAIARDYDEEPEERPATFTYKTTSDAPPVSFAVKIRPRGKSRRDKSTCRFPPLRLNFETKALAGSLFHKQDKLKLVTHCTPLGNPARAYQRYLQLEYLTYRMLNEITPDSFRVRPLEVTYVVADAKNKAHTHPAFLIESKERLGKRLALKLSEAAQITPSKLAPSAAAMTELFEFMIGNTDFSILQGPKGDRCCHNSVIYEQGDEVNPSYLPVAYDFDATGFVNPPYAQPAKSFRLSSVRKRLFRGFCRDPVVMNSVRQRFVEAKPRILALIAQHHLLEDSGKQSATGYIEQFYRLLENQSRYEQQIIGKCRD